MKRILLVCSIVSVSLAARAQQQEYLMTAVTWAQCGQVQATVDGQSFLFNVGWDKAYYTSRLVTFDGPMEGKTVTAVITGDASCCAIYYPGIDCNSPQVRQIHSYGYPSVDCYSASMINSWELDLTFTALKPPVVESAACERVLVNAPSFCYSQTVKWEISKTPLDPASFRPLGGWHSSQAAVTAEAVQAAGLDPYAGSIYIRYIPGALTSASGDAEWFRPSTSIPIDLYHPAPTMTLTPTDQVCTTVSGVTFSNVNLVFGQTTMSLRRELGAGAYEHLMQEKPFTTAELEGMFLELVPGKYELIARNAGGPNAGDICQNTFMFEIKGIYPEVQITPTVTHEKCFGPEATGAIALTAGGPGITPPLTYTWAHDAALTAKDLTGLAGDRTYTVQVRDKNGCIGNAAIPVEEPDAITITQAYVISDHNGAAVSCNSNTIGTKNDGAIRVEASGGTLSLEYRLAGNAHAAGYQADTDFTGLYADVYSVYVRDVNNCEVKHTATVSVTEPNDITYSRLDITKLQCANVHEGAITVVGATGGTGGLQYALNGGAYQASNTFDNRAAGIYTVSIGDRNGCRKDITAEIEKPDPLTFTSIDLQPESCADKLDGIITAVASGGTGQIEYALEDVPSAYRPSGQFTGLKADTYTVYVRDAADCGAAQQATVLRKAALTGPIAITKPVRCHGESNGTLTVTAGGGTPPYQYAWSANANNATTTAVANLPSDNYTVIIRDSKGCEDTFGRTLPQPEALALTVDLSDYHGYGVRCASSADGSIDLGVAGGTEPYQYNWGADGTAQDLRNKPAGTYRVVVTDSRGCEAIRDDLVLKAPPILQLTTGIIKNISCKDGADGQVPLQAGGGAGAYRYSADGLTWQPEPVFEKLKARGYTFLVRDANNCEAPANATLTEPLKALTLAIASQTETVCAQANGSAEVKADGGTGAYAYTWYDGTTVISQTTTATALRSGDYDVVVRDDNFCEATVTVIMNDSDGPLVTQRTLQGLTCHDSNDGRISIDIKNGAAPYTLTWDIPGQGGLEVSNVTGGEHWVEVLDSKNCRAKLEFKVPEPLPVTIGQTVTTPTCQGDTDGKITVEGHGGNIGGYQYQWTDNDATGPLREGLGAGSYTVVVSDVKNCRAEATIVLADPAAFTVDAGGDRSICIGQRVTVDVQHDAIATYQWTSSTGFTSGASAVELREPGTYTLSVVSVRGCEATDSFVIQTANDILQADFLMAAQAVAGDTVVVVDISWPVPEGVQWTVPEGAALIGQEEAYGSIVFADPGEYTIVLNTFLGECIATLSKNITIQSGGGSKAGREGGSLIADFDVYPNPNNGRFTVSVALRRADVVARVRMLSITGDRRLFDAELLGNGEYQYQGNALPAGVYLVLLEAGKEQRVKRVVVE